ncbi:MAG: hypothetical protein IJ555_07445 [Ruminococcus sp.]|nr:hypothetical protein [Ruminococcus sp.]
MNAFIAENDQEIHEEEKPMNEKFEKYLKDLDPELQEKARACKSLEELTHLAAENDLELPEEALEMVSGGCGGGHSHSGNTEVYELWDLNIQFRGNKIEYLKEFRCTGCSYKWFSVKLVNDYNEISISEAEFEQFKKMAGFL